MKMPIFEQLGLMGIPLMICAAFMAAIIIERLFFFLLTRPVSQKLMDQLIQQLNREPDNEIKQELQETYLGRVLLSLVMNKTLPEKERENYFSLQLMGVENHMSRYLAILKTLTTVSPLLGLLGTVLGMIDSFQSISSINRPITPSLVAGGVSQALLTTAVGLVLAIPALIAHSLFQIRINKLIHQLTFQMNEVNIKISLLHN